MEIPPHQHNHLIYSHERAYEHCRVSIVNEFHDVTTPTERLAGFIVSSFLHIAIFARYFSTLKSSLSHYVRNVVQ